MDCPSTTSTRTFRRETPSARDYLASGSPTLFRRLMLRHSVARTTVSGGSYSVVRVLVLSWKIMQLLIIIRRHPINKRIYFDCFNLSRFGFFNNIGFDYYDEGLYFYCYEITFLNMIY